MRKSIQLASILAVLLSGAYSYGLDNPDSLYSAGLAGADPTRDPHGQMRNFLGITWNFLPENTKIQKDVKTRYAQIYTNKYGQPPTDIQYTIPPSANMERMCEHAIEKYREYANKMRAEKRELTDHFAQQKKKLSAIEVQLGTLEKTCGENKTEYERAEHALQEEREQCEKDINAIQQGYGTLVAYRNAFREKEKDLTEKMTTFISLRYGTCNPTEEVKKCEDEREESLSKVAKDLENLLPLIQESANSLQKALNDTIGIDLEIPIQVRVAKIDYNLAAITRQIQGHIESNKTQ